MVVFHDIREIPALESRTVLTLGNFDGIHLGHRYIINSCIFKAKNNNARSVVVSYDHQNSPLYGPDKNFIYLNHEKIQILEELGVDYLLLIPFNENVKNISARNFLFDIISQNMRARWIVIGYDHHFGNNREGNIAYLKEHEKELDYEVRQIEPVVYNEKLISSSRIRTEIESGDFRAANEMLGFPYHGGLVVRELPVHLFLDDTEPPVALHDRGDRHARSPDRPGHAALRVFLRMNSAIRPTPASIAWREAA